MNRTSYPAAWVKSAEGRPAGVNVPGASSAVKRLAAETVARWQEGNRA